MAKYPYSGTNKYLFTKSNNKVTLLSDTPITTVNAYCVVDSDIPADTDSYWCDSEYYATVIKLGSYNTSLNSLISTGLTNITSLGLTMTNGSTQWMWFGATDKLLGIKSTNRFVYDFLEGYEGTYAPIGNEHKISYSIPTTGKQMYHSYYDTASKSYKSKLVTVYHASSSASIAINLPSNLSNNSTVSLTVKDNGITYSLPLSKNGTKYTTNYLGLSSLTNITLTISPYSSYAANIDSLGITDSANSSASFSKSGTSYIYSASFNHWSANNTINISETIKKFSYSVNFDTAQIKSFTVDGTGVSNGGTFTKTAGSTFSIKAVANTGYVFTSSSGISGYYLVLGSGNKEISKSGISAVDDGTFSITAESFSVSTTWGASYDNNAATLSITNKILDIGQTTKIKCSDIIDKYEFEKWVFNSNEYTTTEISYTPQVITKNLLATCYLKQVMTDVEIKNIGLADIIIKVYSGASGLLETYNLQKDNDTTDQAIPTKILSLLNGNQSNDGLKAKYFTISLSNTDSNYFEVVTSGVQNLRTETIGEELRYFIDNTNNKALINIGTKQIRYTISYQGDYPTGTALTKASIYQEGDYIDFVSGNFDAEDDQNPFIYIDLKDEYKDEYELVGVKYRLGSINGELQEGILSISSDGSGKKYYEVSVRNHIFIYGEIRRIKYNLDINIADDFDGDKGSVTIKIDGANYNGTLPVSVRYGKTVSVTYHRKYGGRLESLAYSNTIEPIEHDDNHISFNMPESDCSVDVKIGQLETFELYAFISNDSDSSRYPCYLKIYSTYNNSIILGYCRNGYLYNAQEVRVERLEGFQGEEYKVERLTDGIDTETLTRYVFTEWEFGVDNDSVASSTQSDLSFSANQNSFILTAKYDIARFGTVEFEYYFRENGLETKVDVLPNDVFAEILENKWTNDNGTGYIISAESNIPYKVTGATVQFEQDGSFYDIIPIEVYTKYDDQEYVFNESWDNSDLTQTGSFVMLADHVTIKYVFLKKEVLGRTVFQLGFAEGSNNEMGQLSIFSTNMESYNERDSYTSASVLVNSRVVIMASPKPGYRFVCWIKESQEVSGAGAILELQAENVPYNPPTYYAQFEVSNRSHVSMWNSDINESKRFVWRSKVYVGTQYIMLNSLQIYSDKYPVYLSLYSASSPNNIFDSNSKMFTLGVHSQKACRLPKVRPEKYFAISIEGSGRVNHISIGSSMEALK